MTTVQGKVFALLSTKWRRYLCLSRRRMLVCIKMPRSHFNFPVEIKIALCKNITFWVSGKMCLEHPNRNITYMLLPLLPGSYSKGNGKWWNDLRNVMCVLLSVLDFPLASVVSCRNSLALYLGVFYCFFLVFNLYCIVRANYLNKILLQQKNLLVSLESV